MFRREERASRAVARSVFSQRRVDERANELERWRRGWRCTFHDDSCRAEPVPVDVEFARGGVVGTVRGSGRVVDVGGDSRAANERGPQRRFPSVARRADGDVRGVVGGVDVVRRSSDALDGGEEERAELRGADVERGGRGRRRQLVGVRQSHHHARREGGSERADDEIDRLFVLEAESTIGGDVGVHHGVVIGDVGGEFAEDAGGGAPFDVEESGRVPHRYRVRVVELVLEAKTLGGANLERADGRVAVHQRVDHGGLTNPGLAQHEHAELVARVQPSALVVREVQIETNGRVDGGRRRRAGVGRGGATPTRTTTRTARSGTNRRARRRETNERARRHGTTATTAPGCYLSCAPDICR